jgi:lipoprotein-anchoring transpeptidase ErfK/SrfK
MNTCEVFSDGSSAPARRNGRRGGVKAPKRSLAAGAAVAAALLLAACGGGDSGAAAGAPAPIGAEALSALPEATTFGQVDNAPVDPSPQTPTGGEVVHPKDDMAVYGAVAGQPIAKLPAQQISSPTWVPVVARQGDWAQVLLPARPNAASGWVYTGGGAVETAKNDYVVNINRDAFKLAITKGGQQLGEWTIGTGKPEHPTPKGRAFIIASVEEAVNTYSPIVLPLSVHSDSLETFGGGPGTVGIHTWPDNSFVGKTNSDGCIRVSKEALDRLVELPLGTIVNIT